MTDFKREERYIVVKIKDLTPVQRVALQCHLEEHATPTRECVVVEPDWAIYDETWENVQRLAEGRPSIGEERDEYKRAAEHYVPVAHALAAHAERVKDWWGDERKTRLDLQEFEAIVASSPETSLARLKAEWQADQTEQIREMCEGLTGSQIRSALDGLLAGLRHRAKEPHHD